MADQPRQASLTAVAAFIAASLAIAAVYDLTSADGQLPPVAPQLSSDSVPQNLEETFVVLAKSLPSETLEAMRSGHEDDMIRYHMGLGMWMRNNWIRKGGPLWNDLAQLGLRYPDDMSGLILTSFWRYLNDEPLRVEAQVSEIDAYYRTAKPPKKPILVDQAVERGDAPDGALN